jgi:hypothetical protein
LAKREKREKRMLDDERLFHFGGTRKFKEFLMGWFKLGEISQEI